MTNLRIVDVVLLVLLLSTTILIVVDIKRLSTATAQCVKEPLVYGVQRLENTNNLPAQCVCSLTSDQPHTPILVTSDGISNQITPFQRS